MKSFMVFSESSRLVGQELNRMRREAKKEEAEKKKKEGSAHTEYLKQQLEFKKQKYAEQQQSTLEKQKEKEQKKKEEENKEYENQQKSIIKDIKTKPIKKEDSTTTATTTSLGNVGSLARGLVKLAMHRKNKPKEESEDQPKSGIQPEKRERKPIGRPPTGRPPRQRAKTGTKPERRALPPSPERRALPPAGGSSVSRMSPPRLPGTPERKALPPAGGSSASRMRSSGTKPISEMRLEQRARRNSELRQRLINAREELLWEVDNTEYKSKKKVIIDVMKGENTVEINPQMKEEKDYEGGMARNEMDTIIRAVKSLRKKIKTHNQQLPAWVQSKITKAADHIDTVSDYMSGEHEKINEECIKEIAPLIALAGRVAAGSAGRAVASRVAGSAASNSIRGTLARKAGQMTADTILNRTKNNQEGGDQEDQGSDNKSLGSNFIKKMTNMGIRQESCGCEMDDKKKVLIMAFKKALSDKKRKNSQLNSGIIGESEDWQKSNRKDKVDGLSQKTVDVYRREHPGSKLQTAVTEKSPTGKRKKRRSSFCRRMKGMKKRLTSAKTARDPNSRINKALRRWRCR